MDKESIVFLYKSDKRGWAKGLIKYYEKEIMEGVPYAAIIDKIKREFGIDMKYNTFVLGVRSFTKKHHLTKMLQTDPPATISFQENNFRDADAKPVIHNYSSHENTRQVTSELKKKIEQKQVPFLSEEEARQTYDPSKKTDIDFSDF